MGGLFSQMVLMVLVFLLGLLQIETTLMGKVYNVQSSKNISCEDPPSGVSNFSYQRKASIKNTADPPPPCIDITDCDPYGPYICTYHKEWSQKCCAEYCGFCH